MYKYGLKVTSIEKGRGINIQFPKIDFRHNTSGFGEAKTTPYYMTVNGKTHRRFNTLESMKKYHKKYRNRRTREKNKIFNSFQSK